MIKPRKYMNLNNCVLNCAATLLQYIQVSKVTSVSDLHGLIIKSHGVDSKYNILPALSFLYLLGLVEYSDFDAIKYSGPTTLNLHRQMYQSNQTTNVIIGLGEQ